MDVGGAYSDERLIELVRNRESLFDRTRPDYKDDAVKAAAWSSISQILNMPPEDCQNRWVRLRERFGRELRTRQLGQSDDLRGVRRPWPLFNQMYWLRRFIQPRNRFSNNPARIACQAAQAASSDHNIGSNANYESQSAGPLWAPLWVSDDNDNSVSAETVEDIKTMADEDALENAAGQEEDIQDGSTDPFWGINDIHGGHKRQDDSLNASLAASLISVSAALSGLARRIQDEKRNCSCGSGSGCDNEDEFGRSIATLVRNLPQNRRMGVKARLLAVLASETASAAQEENSSEDRHSGDRDGHSNAK